MPSEVILEDGYAVLVLSGEVKPGELSTAPRAVREEFARSRRVLLDVSEMDAVHLDPMTVAEVARQNAGGGVRYAIAASTPAMFGLGRQVALLSGLEGEAISVFHSRAEAAEWLLSLSD